MRLISYRPLGDLTNKLLTIKDLLDTADRFSDKKENLTQAEVKNVDLCYTAATSLALEEIRH
jgi:hypothetical protein